MTIPKDFLLWLVEQSATVDERRQAPFEIRHTLEPDASPWLADARDHLAQWKGRVSHSSEAFFARRLAWDDLNEDTAMLLLGPARWTGETLPSWAELLGACLEQAKSFWGKPLPHPRFLVDERP